MQVVNNNQKIHKNLTKTLVFFGLISLLILTVIITVIFSNKLLIKKYGYAISGKLENALIGDTNFAVASFSDLQAHLFGAMRGIFDTENLPELRLSIKQEDLIVMMTAKADAKKKWSPALLGLADSPPEMKTKIRLKGDREMHAETISDLSFRINLRGDNRLFGLEEFSIQRPLMRGYTWELLISEVFKKQNLPTLISQAVDFKVNGDSRGVYIIEEVPNGRTLERNKKKDGPIFGLDENFGSMMSSKLDVYEAKKWHKQPIYQQSKKTLEKQFLVASKGEAFSWEYFDIDEWAKFFALNDIFGSYHGTVPKSVKFYFNPVHGKFQPLLFDAHVGAGSFPNFILLDFVLGNAECGWICTNENFYLGFLRDPEFIRRYVSNLEKFSETFFTNSILEIYANKFESLDNRLYSNFARNDNVFYRGFSLWLFKPEYLHERATIIKDKISIYKDKEASIVSHLSQASRNNASVNFEGSLNIPSGVNLIKSRNVDIVSNIIEFKSPTIWILEGTNSLFGLNENDFITIKGPIMIVQMDGTLSAGNLAIVDGVEHDIPNRNWSGALNIINSNIDAETLKIVNNSSEDAINFVSSQFNIELVDVQHSRSDAIDFDFSSGKLLNVICQEIGNDCLDGSESMFQVEKVYAKNVKDKVISAGENSKIFATELEVDTSAIALVSKDGASLSVGTAKLSNVDLFAAAFNKKPEYKRPKLHIKSVYSSAEIFALRSMDSDLQIKDPDIEIKTLFSKEIEELMYGATYGVATEK